MCGFKVMYSNNAISVLTTAFIRLKGSIIGNNIAITASLGVPMNIGVRKILKNIIAPIHTISPITQLTISPLVVLRNLYISPATIVNPPVAKRCINIPIIPPDADTVVPCIMQARSAVMNPAAGPKANVDMNIGTSARSYSRNVAAGKIGKCIINASITAKAVISDMPAIFFVVILYPPQRAKEKPNAKKTLGALSENIMRNYESFSHPDYTVGAGITPARHINVFTGYTVGEELHLAPKLFC